MRKQIKPEVKCKKCGHTTEHAEFEEFCDQCGKQMNVKDHEFLHLTVFITSDEVQHLYFCSWKCVRAYLVTHCEELQKTHFVSLPYPVGLGQDSKGDTMANFFKDFLGFNNEAQVNPKCLEGS